MRARCARGQASLELLAWLPALMLAALVAWHLLVAGYLLVEVDGAAEAGALALAAGAPAADNARAALPGWSRDTAAVEVTDGGRITVAVHPPSPFKPLAEALAVSSTAWARPPGDG
jgi:uncharacterized protein (UPF0333 family)